MLRFLLTRISLIIPNAPGGSFDLYARLAANHLGRFIPGNPAIVPQNMPGAAGMLAANYLASVAPKDGTVIGQYMIHYGDGSGEGISIVYGEDVRDWFYTDDEATTTRGKVVWTGDNDWASQNGAKIRLYLTSWDNPHPDKRIVSIDYLGKKSETPAAPFCVAISLEK